MSFTDSFVSKASSAAPLLYQVKIEITEIPGLGTMHQIICDILSQVHHKGCFYQVYSQAIIYIKVEIRSNNSSEFKSLGNCIEIYAIYTI